MYVIMSLFASVDRSVMGVCQAEHMKLRLQPLITYTVCIVAGRWPATVENIQCAS